MFAGDTCKPQTAISVEMPIVSCADKVKQSHCTTKTDETVLLPLQLRKPGAEVTLRIYCSLLLLCYWLVLCGAR